MKKLLVLLMVLLSASLVFAATGSVNAYTTLEEPLAAALFARFEEETGIHVNFVRLSGGAAKSKGLTTPYISRYSAKTPAEFKDPDNYWIGLYVGPLTFVTNLDRAAELGLEVPHSWEDLTKPEYKGYIRMANPNSSGTAYNVITTIRYIFNEDEDAMMDYMKRLDANIDQYTRSGSAPGKSVATGEIPIAIGYAHDQVKLKVEGANVEITAPSEGTGYELASMSLVKGGPDAVNARRLYDWIISDPDAQEIFTQWYVVLVAEGAAKHPDALSIDEIKTVKQDFAWDGDAANKERLLDWWTNEIGNKRGN